MASLQIVDAIQQIMDDDGSLNALRSEMAASVLRILQGKRNEKSGQQVSSKAKEYLGSKDGEIVIGLVRDLLSSLELNHTLRLFDTECELNSDDFTRSKTSEKLSMSIGISGGQAPLVEELVKSYQDLGGHVSPVMSRRADKSPSAPTMIMNDKLRDVSPRAKSPGALSDDRSNSANLLLPLCLPQLMIPS
jgi:hypothetical protein